MFGRSKGQCKGKGEGKVVPVLYLSRHAMKAYWGVDV
jgi:hypothetical protein